MAHIQIILQKPNTNLATEMRKMALMPVTFSFLPTLPLPQRNVHLLTVTQLKLCNFESVGILVKC